MPTIEATSDEFQVNNQVESLQWQPSVITLSNGNFLAVWYTYAGITPHVAARLFDQNGNALGNEFQIAGLDNYSVAALSDGGFLVTWTNGSDVFAHRFDATGESPTSTPFLVTDTNGASDYYPTAIGLADGGFVIAWSSAEGNTLGHTDIMARLYNADGSGGLDFVVNTLNAGDNVNDINARMAALADGGFVVTWWQYGASDAFAAVYDSSGTVVREQFRVGSSDGGQANVAIESLSDGGFVIVWGDGGDSDQPRGIVAQRFDASGQPVGGEILVNTGIGTFPAIAALPDGGFAVSWIGGDELGSGIFARAFDENGQALDSAFRVSGVGTGNPPAISAREDGSFLVIWTTMNGEDGDSWGISARTFEVSSDDPPPKSTDITLDFNSVTGDGQFVLIDGDYSEDGFVLSPLNSPTFDNFAIRQPGFLGLTSPALMVSWSPGSAMLETASGGPFFIRSIDIDSLFPEAQTVTFVAHLVGGGTQQITFNVDALRGMQTFSFGDLLVTSLEFPNTVWPYELIDNIVVALPVPTEGDDVLYGDENANTIGGLGGNDEIFGLDGNDMLLGGADHDTLHGGGGQDHLGGQSGSDTLHGGDESDNLDGGTGDDWLYGDAGDDYVDAGSDNDRLFGGAGDDELIGSLGDDTIDGGEGADIVNGSDGIDTASYANATSGVQVHLEAPYVNTGEAAGDQYISMENVRGSAFNDRLVGNFAAANSLWGGDGNDQFEAIGAGDALYGEGGDDLLGSFAISSATLMDGGAGTDTAAINRSADVIAYSFALAADVTLADGTRLVDIERINFESGSGNDFIVGGALDDVVNGSGGNDILVGLGGNDSLRGGADHDYLEGNDGGDSLSGGDGDDFIYGNAGNDLIDGGTGWDRAGFSVGATAGVTVDLNLQGTAQNTGQGSDTLIGIEYVSGTRFSDVLTGDGGDNWLWGGSDGSGVTGDDTISAGAGNDQVEVGAGNHTLNGGTGTDTLSLYGNTTDISSSGVTVSLALQGAGQATEQGTMTISGFENLHGSLHDDDLTGDGGANVLAGDLGNDVLAGGGGDDALYGDGHFGVDTHGTSWSGPITFYNDVATLAGVAGGNDVLAGGLGNDLLDGGAGSDTASYAGAAGGVTVDIGAGTASGADGNDTLVSIENATGSAFADLLTGDGAANQLIGGGGDDVFNGNGGSDVLTGGLGADTFVFDALTDSPAGAPVVITDFSGATILGVNSKGRVVRTPGQGDEIDLSAIDANASAAGDQAFTFVKNGFTGSAGQVYASYDAGTNTTGIFLDVDGDAVADMTITLTGQVNITGADFVL